MIVHLEKDKEALSSQLEENWKLIKKIEPFRDVLDNFQLEIKILLERDKYTSEQMERLTKEAIKNMGHQNHRQKVKYVKTLKKIAPVIATEQCDSSKMTQTPGEPRIPFKGKKMLSESECMCPVCISLLIQPVTFPCNHSLCLKCYKETVEKANLSCPVCRKRISVWARKAAKENKLINMEKWKDIQEAFSEKVRRRLEASEESDKEDEEDKFEAQERRQISCPGEIRQEYEAAIQQIQQKKDEQAKKEEEASKVNFEALQQEEFLSENVEIEEKALMLEKKKSKKNSLFLNPVVRLKKCLKAEDIVFSWRANNCLSGTESFHDSSQLTENRSAIPAGNSSEKNDDLRFATKLQEFFDLMDKKRIVGG
ncbi:E3 ubiquitin-protein ligase rnf168-like isoform X1 [Biomphalaria glabrata]|uniref:RING-type E3 ubiquitin transferase n=2 Tax=Biomphalaria glabrata TaxID=6526 RepID=A0A9W2YHZ2_BIOGL|nr:E3 ubiquitin-protein ligase rnf168-like isoform X1 [Biomphalaria glabrata]